MESKALKRTQSIQRVHLRAAICISSPLFNGRGGQSRFIILPLPPSPSPSPSPIAGIDSPAAAAVAAAIRILLDSPLSAFRSFDLSIFRSFFNASTPECFFFLLLLPPLLLPLRLFVFFAFVIFLVFVLYFRSHTVKNGAPTVSQGRPLHSDWLPGSSLNLIADASSSIAPSFWPSQPPCLPLRSNVDDAGRRRSRHTSATRRTSPPPLRQEQKNK